MLRPQTSDFPCAEHVIFPLNPFVKDGYTVIEPKDASKLWQLHQNLLTT